MKKILIGALALTMAASTAAVAQPMGNDHRGDHRGRGDNHQDQHRGWGRDYGNGGHKWRRGERMGYNDWNSYERVDYRQHHLRAPPRGYEWRRSSDGNYILAAIATGLIASIILGNR